MLLLSFFIYSLQITTGCWWPGESTIQMAFNPNRNSLPIKPRPAFGKPNCSHSEPNDSLCYSYQLSPKPQGLQAAPCHLWCPSVPHRPCVTTVGEEEHQHHKWQTLGHPLPVFWEHSMAGREQLEIFASAHFSNILLLKYKNRLLQERRIWWSSHCEPHSLTYCSNHLFFCSSIIFLFASWIWESSLGNGFASEGSVAWRGQSTEGSSTAQGTGGFCCGCCRTQTLIYLWWIKFLHLSNEEKTWCGWRETQAT